MFIHYSVSFMYYILTFSSIMLWLFILSKASSFYSSENKTVSPDTGIKWPVHWLSIFWLTGGSCKILQSSWVSTYQAIFARVESQLLVLPLKLQILALLDLVFLGPVIKTLDIVCSKHFNIIRCYSVLCLIISV